MIFFNLDKYCNSDIDAIVSPRKTCIILWEGEFIL